MRFLGWVLALLLTVTVWGQTILPKPKSGYVLDRAKLLDSDTISEINSISKGVQRDAHAPIVVVTIPSLASVKGKSVESYATKLFNAWKIGDREHNYGILLLVARKDRKARIEMGAGWGRTMDSQCQEIMSEFIVRNFKQGDYSAGVLEGVQALDRLVRTGEIYDTSYPETGTTMSASSPDPTLVPALIALGFFVLLVLGANFMMRGPSWNRGRRGGPPSTSGRIFRGGGFFGGGGGGFSGGGGGFSGGGFSGGGGASGSW